MKKLASALAGVALSTALVSLPAQAIVIQGTNTAETLAQQLFLSSDDITVQSATLSFGNVLEFGPGEGGEDGEFFEEIDPGDGNPANDSGLIMQAGTYINVGGTYSLPSPGIVLSTGDVMDYQSGPNTQTGNTGQASNGANADQNALLSPLSGQSDHFDPIQLDIEFLVTGGVEEISFIGIFGSEEFPEFQNEGVNDAFGLFVNGTNVAAAIETGGTPPGLPVNIDHPDFADIAGTELDGLLAPNGNPLLRFDVPVVDGLNTFTIILADAGDDILDTTVYLSSFGDFTSTDGSSEFTPILPSNEPDEGGTFVIELPDVSEGDTIWIDPPVSVGFTYEANNAEFAAITAPSTATVNDPDGFEIVINGMTYAIASGATFDIVAATGGTVTSFVLQGIDPALMLDPANPVAFPLGIALLNVTGSVTIDMTPITVDVPNGVTPVPVPAAGALYLLGLAGIGAFARRRRS